MVKYFITTLLACFSITVLLSQTHLPAIFSTNMVLQQKQLVSIWGTDSRFTKVTVSGSWGENGSAKADSNGHWKIKLATPSAGGPYKVIIRGSDKIIFENVLIGEIWLCSGQSNMEMPVKGYVNQPVKGSNETILNSLNDNIRFLNTPRSVSLTPLSDVKGEWKSASAATTGNFSATAYYFAKKLQALLGVPIGIIQTAWGASTIESWMDAPTLSVFDPKLIPEKLPEKDANRTPTMMYNSMLHPYVGYTIKGVLWYQGEANRMNANEYHSLFTSMITSWRKLWQQGEFPFYFVQIAPFEPGKENAALLREAQLKTMSTVKHTGMAVTMDLGERNVIHPSQKEEVGTRLAYWALAKDYNFAGLAFSGPVYRDMQKMGNGKIMLTFDFSEQGLTSFGKALTDFEIAGEDKVFYPAQVKINNEKIGSLIVWNDAVKTPVSVRYAFKNWAEGSLYNTQGLPSSSFRTDDWIK